MAQRFNFAQVMLKLLLLLALTTGLVLAAPILGTLKIGGEAEVTQTTIDFSVFIPGAALNGTGDVVVLGGGTGPFSPLVFGNFGTIYDRSVAGGVVPPQPAGDNNINVMNWLTFTNPAFRYALDLKFISVGTYSSVACAAPPADGQTCTPPAPTPFESPYNLTNFIDTNAGLSANATFSVRGLLRNLDTGLTPYAFSGVFGAEFLGQSFQDVLAAVSAGGSAVASYSATIDVTSTTVVPEPSTAVLTALGGLMVLFGSRFRRREK